MKKKALVTVLCLMLVSITVSLGTLAYLTDSDSAVNTFTVGKVDITLDEAAVDEDGKLIVDGEGNPVDRVKGNEYHLIPGQTYIKDPTITVKADSEEAYVRMLVTINCKKELDAIFAPEGAVLENIFDGYNDSVWRYSGETVDETENTITYEFRYHETVTGDNGDNELEALFETFTVPGEITAEELKTLNDFKMIVNGHAIQAAGFMENAETGMSAEDAAWDAFTLQQQ